MPNMVWIGIGDGSDATIFFDGVVGGEPKLGAPVNAVRFSADGQILFFTWRPFGRRFDELKRLSRRLPDDLTGGEI
jgi:hypothetical protein